MSQFVEFNDKADNPQFEGVTDVTPQEVKDKQGSIALIDVRRPDEFTGELGHISGSELIVLDEIPQKINEIPKDKTIVLICRSGQRSAQAAAFMQENGFNNVYNMKGGMLLWNELNFPTTTD